MAYNSKFNKGDFVGNITGIIKVDEITYTMFGGYPDIIYRGYRYKKYKGELLRTKDNNITSLREVHNLKKIK